MTPLDQVQSAPSPSPPPQPKEGAGGPVGGPWTGAPGLMPVLFLAGLALLLASFPARNSDLWRHLAAGRLLARGDFSWGTGPRLPTNLAADHTPLYDLACYGLYSLVGGTGLVVFKALLVVGVALVMLRLAARGHRPADGWSLPAACTALALLAMGTRLLLQPATVSYLFLALALWWALGARRTAPGLLPPWPLLVLFVVWANTDGWFLIGLGAVALVWLGRALDDGRPDELARLPISLAVLAAACLLNPYHVHAFQPPPELGRLGGSPTPGAVTSPFQAAYFSSVGRTPAGLAYFPLLGLGLLAFVLIFPRWSWARSLPWLGLAVLSGLQVRAVPFFAVLAGPVLAWNLTDLLSARWRPGENAVALGRALAGVVGLVLLVCAWPGWLQTPPRALEQGQPPRWGVETDPSLERAASTAARWHREGKLGPDTRALHLSPETASAFAWFCPQDRGLLDAGLAAAVRGDRGAPRDWRARMRSAGVNHVVLYDTDRDRFFATMSRLLEDPQERWPLLSVDGYVAVFGWRGPPPRDPDAQDPFRGWVQDPARLAFHPAEDKRAPRKPSERGPQERHWWDAFRKPIPPRSADHGEATLHLMHAEVLRRTALVRHFRAWYWGQSAGFVGAGAGWPGSGGWANLLGADLRWGLLPRDPEARGDSRRERVGVAVRDAYLLHQDDAPPALLYLAVRAARRALAANPDDAGAYQVLGESYFRLLYSTRERSWGARLPELVSLRRAQVSAALSQALALKPDLVQAHLVLGQLYREMGYLDLALKHLRAYSRLAGGGGSREELSRLARQVEDAEQSYAAESAGLSVLDRAVLARQKGLAGRARDLLLESHVAAFGAPGLLLEMDLLLTTGRSRQLRDWLLPEHKETLGADGYHQMRTLALAASGAYEEAGDECADWARDLFLRPNSPEPIRIRQTLVPMLGRVLMGEQPAVGPVPFLLWRSFARSQFREMMVMFLAAKKREADVGVLRGLLALEEGEVEDAAAEFRRALGVWKDEAAAASGAGLDFSGRVIAQECLEWLSRK